MIEPLNVELWTTEPAGLDGLSTIKSEPVQRVVCSYFPPHTSWTKELLESDSPYLNTGDYTGPEFIETSEGSFRVSQILEVNMDNGGAVYFLGVLDDDGNREGWLWRLTEGKSSG